jgi:hypothetical protein
MGIPGLSNWLKRKYPGIIEQCKGRLYTRNYFDLLFFWLFLETENASPSVDEMQPNLHVTEVSFRFLNYYLYFFF